jgi:hypothetical protein
MGPVKVVVVVVVVVAVQVGLGAHTEAVVVAAVLQFMLAVALSLLHTVLAVLAVKVQFVLFGVLVAHVAHHHSHQLMWERK